MSFLGNFSILLLATIHQISRAKSDVTIFPGHLTVLEGNNGTVKCSYSGNISLQGVSFYFNISTVATLFLPNCTNGLGLQNYKTDCEGNGTFTLTMINISKQNHSKGVRCVIYLQNTSPENSTKQTFVYVNVPVKNVSVTTPTIEDGVVSVCEKVNISLHCKTSAARPAANISWIYQSKISTGGTDTVTFNSNTSNTEVNDLFITFSTLYIIANRSLNSWHILCSSGSYPDIVVNSSSITFDILYPPELPPTISNVNVTNGDTYSIIEGRQGVLTCVVPISNPITTLTWIGLEPSHNISKSLDFVSNDLEWVASRGDNNISTCIAKHRCNNSTKSIFVRIEVLYPPETIPMEDVSIVEGSFLNITCNITLGKPDTLTINWTRKADILITNSTRLTIMNISRDLSSNYTCKVANLMKPTIGIEEIGESSSSVFIDILYPPTVKPIKNQTAIEGLYFNLSCQVNPGNPDVTNVSWTSIERGIRMPTQFLLFENISRNDTAIYTCTAFNIMIPTNNAKVEGYDSESFHLIVEYRAFIKKFFMNGYEGDSNVTLNEHDNVTFHCYVDSLPISTTDIQFQNGSKLKTTNTTNNVSYYLGQATCLDAGKYECSGRNKHTSIQDDVRKQLILFVNCYPRAHPMMQIKSSIATSLNVPLALNFTAVAYPLPTTVNWQKLNGSTWTIITEYNNISIIESNLIFNLTFQNVQQEDLGKYKLVIINTIDEFEQNFTIIPADIPKAPSKFRVLIEKISTSSITVVWYPSFNGGQPQHFILNISKSDEQIWTSDTVEDTGDTYMNYTFDGLSSGTLYKFNIYAENTIGRSNISNTLLFETKDQDSHKEYQDGSTLAIVVGVVSGLTGIIVAVVLVIWFLRKRHQKVPARSVYQNVPFNGKAVKSNTNKKKKSSSERETNVDENILQEVDDVPNIQTERIEYCNTLEKIEEIERINVTELFQYVIGKDEDEFAIEYQKIPTELQKSCIFARKPENIALNRYNGIFPYDHSRVKIPVLPDFFMNACYIDGFQKDKAYIASLGPTEKTTYKYISFWQMVWHEKSDVIVMLTNLREISGMKCEQYWPDDGSITYGEIFVSCLKTEIFAEYTVRTFRLSKDKEHQTVTHLHYTAWPDKTVPEDVTSLLEFRQRMLATPTTSQAPIIIHCSAGIGRTGTLIAIDRLVEEGRARKSVDVFECVKSMREQRVKMVQTLEQYIFVYKALAYALSFDYEAMTIKDFPKHVDATHSSKYSRQFQQLKQTVEKDKKEEKEARNKNEKLTNKNRLGADIPGDRFRVFLNLDKEDDSNYINAVYINSFKTKDIFIIGQTPLRSTVKDFISMAYQENCICIVTMDDLNESERTVAEYISESKQKTYGNFNISSSILETKHQYILREMKIKYEGKYQRGEKRVYHFQYTKWLQENQTPEKAEDFVRFVKEVHQYANELGNETSHILVHCLNAYERSGLFCAVSVIMEKLQLEDCVSVTNTVRHLRTRRRSVINSKEQLLFCYQAAGAFIRSEGN